MTTPVKLLKRVAAALDYVFAVLLSLAAFLLISALIVFHFRGTLRGKRQPGRRRACLVRATLNELQTKGNSNHILFRDLRGYFDHVYTIHFPAERNMEVGISERHTVVEYAADPVRICAWFPLCSMLAGEINMLLKLHPFIQRKHVDVLCAHDPYVQGLNALILSALVGIPYVVVVVSNYDLTRRSTGRLAYHELFKFAWFQKLIGFIVFSQASGVFAMSEDNRRFAIRNGASQEKSITVETSCMPSQLHMEPSSARRDLRTELGLDRMKIVLYAGRLSPEKYPDDVVRCARAVKALRQDACFLLAGDGPMRGQLKILAKELGVSDKVRFIGFQTQERLRDLMHTADVIVSPLTGISLIEAALSGSPIVAYDVEWQGELIKNGETGMLVQYRDWRAMANAVAYLLTNPETGKTFGKRAREEALLRYHPDVLMQKETDAFNRLLRA